MAGSFIASPPLFLRSSLQNHHKNTRKYNLQLSNVRLSSLTLAPFAAGIHSGVLILFAALPRLQLCRGQLAVFVPIQLGEQLLIHSRKFADR